MQFALDRFTFVAPFFRVACRAKYAAKNTRKLCHSAQIDKYMKRKQLLDFSSPAAAPKISAKYFGFNEDSDRLFSCLWVPQSGVTTPQNDGLQEFLLSL